MAQSKVITANFSSLPMLRVDRPGLEGLTPEAEVSLKLSAVGQALPGDGERIALEHAHLVCGAAERAGTAVTLDMEDHTTTDSTLRILAEVRKDFPSTGAVLQAYLRRTEADCRDLATAGSRVRLCKGAYDEPESVAFRDRANKGPQTVTGKIDAESLAGIKVAGRTIPVADVIDVQYDVPAAIHEHIEPASVMPSCSIWPALSSRYHMS